MSVIQAGNTTTTSLIYSGDTTGNLVFTTGTSNTVTLTIPSSGGIKFPDGTSQNTSFTNNSVTVSSLSNAAVGTGVGYVRDAGSNYVIWVAPNGTRTAQCWGTTAFNGSGVANISFPITFASNPSVTASVYRGTTLSGYVMTTQIGSVTTTGVTIIGNYTTGGSVASLTGNEAAAWIASGSY